MSKLVVLMIASVNDIANSENKSAYTIGGERVHIPARIADGVEKGEYMVVTDQLITQRRALDEAGNPVEDEDGNPVFVALDVPTTRKTATFIGSQVECFEQTTEAEMSEVLAKEYITLAKEQKLEELRAQFKLPAKKAVKAEETIS